MNEPKKVPIVLTLNRGYIKQATVVMLSALQNANKNTMYHFYLITYDLLDEDLTFLYDKLGKFGSLEKIEIKYISQTHYEAIPHFGEYGKETNFRLFIPSILPELKKIIYLDCDILVLGDLAEMYDIDISNKAFAACNERRKNLTFLNPALQENINHHHSYSRFRLFEKFGFSLFDKNSFYAAAGVLLINNEYWIEKKYTQRVLKFFEVNRNDCDIKYPDQDIINIMAMQDGVDSVYFLDWKYNWMHFMFGQDKNIDIQNLQHQGIFYTCYMEKSMSDDFLPTIVHYAWIPP